MRSWVVSGLLLLSAGSSLSGCFTPDDFIGCFEGCGGRTFVRLDPPIGAPGKFALTVKAGWVDATCTVTVPLHGGLINCPGAPDLQVWASDDASSDFAGISLYIQPASVRVEIRREGEVLVDRSSNVTVRSEGDECSCMVGRASISTLR